MFASVRSRAVCPVGLRSIDAGPNGVRAPRAHQIDTPAPIHLPSPGARLAKVLGLPHNRDKCARFRRVAQLEVVQRAGERSFRANGGHSPWRIAQY